MTKKVTVRHPEKLMFSFFRDRDQALSEINMGLTRQALTCEDGKVLARTHFGMNPQYLMMGVTTLANVVTLLFQNNQTVSPSSEIWNYLEYGFELLGLMELSRNVRSNIGEVTCALQTESNFEYFTGKLNDAISRSRDWSQSEELRLFQSLGLR
ncbi:MAG: hypothetical protein DKT66_06705 [Candidatus Melainabacteria bacterium]|nr:MAG: hypothetical protein DKT66_06705 [Candidatus Melainabacteria bacterium]